jgi:hypothetical protein
MYMYALLPLRFPRRSHHVGARLTAPAMVQALLYLQPWHTHSTHTADVLTAACHPDGVLLRRPHGFRSVGRVKADTALGRLLLQGLHVFLATFHDPAALLHLHKRHNR